MLVPIAALEIAVCVGVGLLLRPAHLDFFWGLGIGVAVAMVLLLADSPPHRIERWRQGAEGERATGKALRPLIRNGWAVVHDVQHRGGNFDHVLVGPAGVFLLETKNLRGNVAVKRGVLSVRWPEAPDDGYDNEHLARRARASAATLSGLLQGEGIRIWVQPVVVLWGRFDQASIQSESVAWVAGKALTRVLRARPTALSAGDIGRVTAILGSAAFAVSDQASPSRAA